MRRLGFGFFLILFAMTASSLSAEGDSCRDRLKFVAFNWVQKQIRASAKVEPSQRRIREAAQQTDLSVLARNGDILKNHNDHYSVVVRRGEITNQEDSGKCWIFAGLSMLRAALIGSQLVPTNFQLSSSYLHFFSYLEQANAYLEKVIEARSKEFMAPRYGEALSPTKLGEGGYFGDFAHLIEKYGLVPQSVMPETDASKNTEAWLEPELQNLLGRVAQEIFDEVFRERGLDLKAEFPEREVRRLYQIKARGMTSVWKLLTLYLGVPPEKFEFRYGAKLPDEDKKWKVAKISSQLKVFTPQSFAEEIVGFKADDYIEIDYNPRFEFGKVYEIKDSAIGVGDRAFPAKNRRVLNLPIQRLMEITVRSLDKGHPVWFGGDVDKDVDHESGIMHTKIFDRSGIYGWTAPETFSALRLPMAMHLRLQSGGHAMLISGYDRPKGKGVVKFRVENSWGTTSGDAGIFHLYKEWFEAYVSEIAVLRKFLRASELKALSDNPTPVREIDWNI
jgi:bleomycin hydrolase